MDDIAPGAMKGRTIVYFANTDWYLYNFRHALIGMARDEGMHVVCAAPPGEYLERLQGLGIECVPIPLVRMKSGLLSLIPAIWTLRGLFRRVDPHICHSFTLTSILMTWVASLGYRSMVRINAVTGMGYAFIGQRLSTRVIRMLLEPIVSLALNAKRAWTVVQNAADGAFLQEQLGVNPNRIACIAGSGVDITRFRPLEKSRDGGNLTVAFVGRLLVDKGIREFIDAARQLKRAYPEVKFVAAGTADKGNPATISMRELESLQRERIVTFLGDVTDMPGFYRNTDILVLPSYREGLSRSLIEAAACGIPAVTTDVPGCRDVVTDEKSGLLVPPRDAGGLSHAIERLIDDPGLRLCMGRTAREYALRYFTDRLVNEQTFDFYRTATGTEFTCDSSTTRIRRHYG